MRKGNLFLLIFLVVASGGFAQHYSLFSNYINNGLVINPAYAGRHEVMDASVLHRRQWTGLSGSPVTTAFSVNSPLKKKSLNLGFTFVDDRIGATAKQHLNGIYAYRFQAGKFNCSFGVQAGAEFSRVNWDRLARNDQNDEMLLGQSARTMGITGGAGFYMYNDVCYFGLSSPYLINTNSRKSAGYSPLLLNGAWKFTLKDSSAIRPSFLARYAPGSPLQYDLNVSYHYRQKYGIGVSYRAQESFVMLLEIPFDKQIRFYYSYDFGTSKMRKFHNGSHEIMLRYLFIPKPAEKLPEEPPATN